MPADRSTLLRYLIVVSLVTLIGYGLFEARRLISGPIITINSPQAGQMVQGPVVRITGQVNNAAFLSVNSRQVLTDKSGNFVTALSPTPGYVVLSVSATDRFGKTRTRTIPLIVTNYCPV